MGLSGPAQRRGAALWSWKERPPATVAAPGGMARAHIAAAASSATSCARAEGQRGRPKRRQMGSWVVRSGAQLIHICGVGAWPGDLPLEAHVPLDTICTWSASCNAGAGAPSLLPEESFGGECIECERSACRRRPTGCHPCCGSGAACSGLTAPRPAPPHPTPTPPHPTFHAHTHHHHHHPFLQA